jgi:hypothetical protein
MKAYANTDHSLAPGYGGISRRPGLQASVSLARSVKRSDDRPSSHLLLEETFSAPDPLKEIAAPKTPHLRFAAGRITPVRLTRVVAGMEAVAARTATNKLLSYFM